jgi:multiple sugar transport system permease protein
MKLRKNIYGKIITYIILVFFALTVIVPFIWVISNAFRFNSEIGQFTGLGIFTFLPKVITLDNFTRMFKELNFVQIMGNTVFVAFSVTLSSLFLNSLAAFAFARINFKGKKVIFIIMLSTLIVPIEVLIVPLYITVTDFKLVNTIYALIIPFMASAFGIFFMRQFFLDVPKELEEAAVLDGCNKFQIFSKIFLPLAKTPLITLGLLTFLQQWDSFIVPVTLINDEGKMLLQVALTYLSAGIYSTDYGILFAGVVLALVPILIVFLFLQKYIVENISATGIKG